MKKSSNAKSGYSPLSIVANETPWEGLSVVREIKAKGETEIDKKIAILNALVKQPPFCYVYKSKNSFLL